MISLINRFSNCRQHREILFTLNEGIPVCFKITFQKLSFKIEYFFPVNEHKKSSEKLLAKHYYCDIFDKKYVFPVHFSITLHKK